MMLTHQNVHHNKESFVLGLSSYGEPWLRTTDMANVISMLTRGHVTLPGRSLLVLWWSSWSGSVGLVQLVEQSVSGTTISL